MVSQYLYISTAPSLERGEIDAILESSARYNPHHGVTGILLYNGRNFLQLLEAEESEIVTLMVKITQDSRHSGVSLLSRNQAVERACPDWAMQRIYISESVSKRRALLEEQIPEGLDSATHQIIVNFATLN